MALHGSFSIPAWGPNGPLDGTKANVTYVPVRERLSRIVRLHLAMIVRGFTAEIVWVFVVGKEGKVPMVCVLIHSVTKE